ncbi:hypothetical protein AVEN_22614-1, partial [Araneus ventricosus]
YVTEDYDANPEGGNIIINSTHNSRGLDGLVVRSRPRGLRAPGPKPDSNGDPPCMGSWNWHGTSPCHGVYLHSVLAYEEASAKLRTRMAEKNRQ